MSIDVQANAFYDFLMGPMTGVPVAIKTQLRDTMRPGNHAHIGVVKAVEAIYRNKAVVPVALLNLAANMAEAADLAGAGGMNIDRRGYRIGTAIRKMAGVEPRPAPDATDPAPLPEPTA